jgi:hypothetical protein
MKKILLLMVFGLGLWAVAASQETKEPEEIAASKQKFTRATFNSTRIINMQSTELVAPGYLQFMISHHFSPFWVKDANTGDNLAQMFGLNSGLASYLSLFDYSPKSWLNLGPQPPAGQGSKAGRSLRSCVSRPERRISR